MITQNYGLGGGTLDGTKHLERAIPRLLDQFEQAKWRAQLRADIEAHAIGTTPGKANADAN